MFLFCGSDGGCGSGGGGCGGCKNRKLTYDKDKSHLDPTMTHGILVTPQKLTILSYTIWIMSNEFLDVMEYTSM